MSTGPSCRPPDLLYTEMVTFTIWTNCLAPTAPLVSGGTKATPSKFRVSAALWPSKFTPGLTSVRGPAKVEATASFCELLNGARVGRAVGDFLLGPPEILEPT